MVEESSHEYLYIPSSDFNGNVAVCGGKKTGRGLSLKTKLCFKLLQRGLHLVVLLKYLQVSNDSFYNWRFSFGKVTQGIQTYLAFWGAFSE